jgi:hypothetical protein
MLASPLIELIFEFGKTHRKFRFPNIYEKYIQMTKSKPITPQEQEYQIINQINAPDCTNVSEHVRRSSHFMQQIIFQS